MRTAWSQERGCGRLPFGQEVLRCEKWKAAGETRQFSIFASGNPIIPLAFLLSWAVQDWTWDDYVIGFRVQTAKMKQSIEHTKKSKVSEGICCTQKGWGFGICVCCVCYRIGLDMFLLTLTWGSLIRRFLGVGKIRNWSGFPLSSHLVGFDSGKLMGPVDRHSKDVPSDRVNIGSLVKIPVVYDKFGRIIGDSIHFPPTPGDSLIVPPSFTATVYF